MKHATALVLLAAACGPSSTQVRQAEESAYNAPFAEVWSAVTEELRKFQLLTEENPVTGVAITEWRLVERTGDEPSQSAAGPDPSQTQTNQNRGTMTYIPGGNYLRYTARIKGPPWKVVVDGEAGDFRPGYVSIIPYRHGVADEPTWLRARVDTMRIAIHEHLRHYAMKTTSDEPARPKPPDATPWDGLPAQAVIVAVHKAAKERSAAQVREHAISDLVWSASAPPSADVAAAMWSADPQTLVTMAQTLEAGCAASGDAVVCPAGAPTDTSGGPHAVFRRAGEAWKLVLYVAR
jgi:hypothetical protein